MHNNTISEDRKKSDVDEWQFFIDRIQKPDK